MTNYFTGQGDQGYTSLLGPERVPKTDPRPEAYGAVDEAQSALGLARALARSPRTAEILLAAQRDLHPLMAELASAGVADTPFAGGVTAAFIERLEGWIHELDGLVEPPAGFIVPGNCPASAALDLARTITRRAERRAVHLLHDGLLKNPEPVRYLNRLSSLLYALARYEDGIAGTPSELTVKRET